MNKKRLRVGRKVVPHGSKGDLPLVFKDLEDASGSDCFVLIFIHIVRKSPEIVF